MRTMPTVSSVVFLFWTQLIWVHACLPGFGLGYNPYPLGLPGMNLGGLGLPYGAAGIPGMPRIGPFRSQANHDPPHEEGIATSSAMLDCANFKEGCKWSNTNTDDMDWIVGQSMPGVEKWYQSLSSITYPDISAAALISQQRRGWEVGYLISDTLPCLPSNLRLTATAWKSKLGAPEMQPKLQVCSRNLNEDRLPLINCNEFDIRNGVPITVDIPQPNNPLSASQIVLMGNNFAAPEGGSIFLQDIRVDGGMDCAGSESYRPFDFQEPASAGEYPKLVDPIDLPPFGASKIMETVPAAFSSYDVVHNSIEAIDAPPTQAVPNPFRSLIQSGSDEIHAPKASVGGIHVQQLASLTSAPITGPGSALKEMCRDISCDATDYINCNFWRSSGGNQWEIASGKRISNSKTSISSAPVGTERFLVAPFNSEKERQFTLVTEALNVPVTEDIFFCFYEYLNTIGFSLAICTEHFDCFYKRTVGESTLSPESGKWTLRCTKLPFGTYELRVIAENQGIERGELGFLPVRLARDSQAHSLLC